MGLLVKGQWQNSWYDTKKSGGEFIREDSQYRHWITADGDAGPTGEGGFIAEADRYHLYVSLACPWAHRTLIFRQLKKLENIISVSIVHPHMLDKGWVFDRAFEEPFDKSVQCKDDVYDSQFLYEIYTRNDTHYSGRVTVPILWDKKRECIVNNESADIIRMFNSAFNHLTNDHSDFYPESQREEIDLMNERVYRHINNGVYKCGFATQQKAYEKAFRDLYSALDFVDDKLRQNKYLVGDSLTEADWRLFTTLVRFDAVYVGHFKCNLKRISDYKHLSHYLKELYQYAGISETVNLKHIKQHYYYSHDTINPTRVVPVGPELDLDGKHNRDKIR
ncbi:MAG: glutathione S-transferase family protein [Cellvibrionaceae bacterium]